MANKNKLVITILLFFSIFISLLAIFRPLPKSGLSIFLELVFLIQPIIWVYLVKNNFREKINNLFLYIGCSLFFIGGILEILDGTLIFNQIIVTTEDTLYLLGIIFITICFSKLAFKDNKKHSMLSESNKKKYIDSINDDLTGLFNHQYLQSNFTTIFDNNPAIFTNSVCVFIDIDNFKLFNDTFGKNEGDRVLSYLGEIICNSKRKGDFAFRFAGQQFVMFYMNSDLKFITDKLEHTKDSFKSYIHENYQSEKVTCTLSMGLTKYLYSEDIQDIIHRADKAMYISKYSGKDRINKL